MTAVFSAPATAIEPVTEVVGTLKSQMTWRDHAGNIWNAASYADLTSKAWTVETLVSAAIPGSNPTSPVLPPSTSATSHLAANLSLPKDIGLKTRISDKGTTGIKTSQIYWRDAAQNVWIAEEFKDSSGYVWTTNTLVASADLGVSPAVPVTA